METAQVYQFPARRDDAQSSGPDSSQGPARSPQVEDGYTRIADELYEATYNRKVCPATATQLCIIHAVIRKTYGYNKTQDWISDTQLAKAVGISRQNVNEAKMQLLAMKVLKLSGDGRMLGINKHYEQWDFTAKPKRKPPVSTRGPDGDTVSKMETNKVSKQETHNRQIHIPTTDVVGNVKTSSRPAKVRKWGEDIDHTLVNEMHAIISRDLTNPKKPNANAWANDFRLMRSVDGRTVEQIRYLITWTAEHHFWSSVILSPAKLRAKWDQLEKQVKQLKESRHANRQPADDQRTERDRIAARLANPNDDDWLDGFWCEEGDDSAAGQQGVHPTGSDLSANVENVFHHGEHGDAGEAGGRIFDGEVADAADHRGAGRSAGTDQGRGERLSTVDRQAGEGDEAPAGGLWHA